jgi:dihydrofolate reductase
MDLMNLLGEEMIYEGDNYPGEARGKVNAIVAADRNWGIGKDGKLLVHLPDDMKFFREKTMGSILVMGRKTFESLPGKGPLDGRINCVLTGNKDFAKGKPFENDIIVETDFDKMLHRIDDLSVENGAADIYFIGGGSVYEQALKYLNEIYVTWIDAEYEADTYFPDLDAEDSGFFIMEDSEWIEDGEVRYSFLTYKNSWRAFEEGLLVEESGEERINPFEGFSDE